MKALLGLAPFVVALPIVVWSAIWQGKHTERWGNFPELSVAAKRVDDIPLEVGDWKGTVGPKFEEDIRRAAGAEGDAQITYQNTKTKEVVNVLVVCGRLTNVWNHRPDRCYPAHGYTEDSERQEHKFETATGATAEFQTATYSRKDQSTTSRLYWAWSSNGKWLAPQDLREDFMRTDPMFKVQFENAVVDSHQTLDQGPSVELIKVLIPELSRVFFPEYKPPAVAAEKPVKS